MVDIYGDFLSLLLLKFFCLVSLCDVDGSDCQFFVYFVTFYGEWMDQIAGAEEPDIDLSLPSVWTKHTPFVIA